MKFTIKGTDTDDNLSTFQSDITIEDSNNLLTVEVWDIFGDDTVITLDEPERSEFIRKVSALKNDVQ